MFDLMEFRTRDREARTAGLLLLLALFCNAIQFLTVLGGSFPIQIVFFLLAPLLYLAAFILALVGIRTGTQKGLRVFILVMSITGLLSFAYILYSFFSFFGSGASLGST